MLQMSGSFLLRRLQALGRTAPPVIALVAPVFFADADGKVHLPVVDARKVLHKPVDVPVLLEAIAEVLADNEALPAQGA
jgi:CheY-like chemotaxis protein